MDQQKQIDELYKIYAQFLINFEYVSHLMRFGILYILFPNHTPRETRQNEILMESLTADQIRSKLMALVAEDFKPDTEIFKLSKTISNIYGRMIPIRNSFAHGTSFIGENPAIKDSKDGLLILRHPKLKKEGLDLNFKKYEINAMKLGIELFEKLRNAVVIVMVTVENKQQGKEDSVPYHSDRHLELTRYSLEKLDKRLQDVLKK